MISAHVDKAGVSPQIVDRRCHKDRPAGTEGSGKSWPATRSAPCGLAPLPAFVLVVADQFLFLGVHRNHGPPLLQGSPHPLIDVPELGVAISMIFTLLGLAVALEDVIQIPQQLRHFLVADRVSPVSGGRHRFGGCGPVAKGALLIPQCLPCWTQ